MTNTLELYECVVSQRTTWFFLRLQTPDGIAGLGECSDAGGVQTITRTMRAVASQFTRMGADIFDQEALRSVAQTAAQGATLRQRTVIGGIEQAFCDAAARRAEAPLWKWLGGTHLSRLPVYANINRVPGGRSPADVASAAARAVEAGFRQLKCAPFDVALSDRTLADAGLARLRSVRAAIGTDVDLMVDCHERLALPDLLPMLPDFADLDVVWLEDAANINRLEDLRLIRAATAIPLAGGEFAAGPQDVGPAVENGLLDVVMPDVKHAGGLLSATAIAAAAQNLAVSPHNPCGPIGTAMSAHLAAACPSFSVLEFAFGEADWRADIVGGAEHISDGMLAIVDGTGLGIDLDIAHPRLRLVQEVTI